MIIARLLLCFSVLAPSAALAQNSLGTWCWLPGLGLEITFSIFEMDGPGYALYTSIEDRRGDTESDVFALRKVSRGYIRDDTGERYEITSSGALAIYSGDELLGRAEKGPC